MMPIKKIVYSLLGVAFAMGLLVACAPHYETRYELTPPKTSEGLQCLKPCEVAANQCRSQCSTRYSSCSAKAAEQAQAVFPALMQQYEVELALWRDERDRYNRERLFRDMRRDQYRMMHEACRASGKEREECPALPHFRQSDHPIDPGFKPQAPTLEAETKRIRDNTCQTDCQCDTAYRSCYSSCGGGVKPFPICVKNCNH